MYVIGDLTEENPIGSQDTGGLLHERQIHEGEGVAIFLGRLQTEAEPLLKVFCPVLPLVGDVRGVIHNYVEAAVTER